MEENKNVSSGVEKAEKINGSSKKTATKKTNDSIKNTSKSTKAKTSAKKPAKKSNSVADREERKISLKEKNFACIAERKEKIAERRAEVAKIKIEKEKLRAKKRLEIAKLKAEKQEARKQSKLASQKLKEERKAYLREQREERKAEKSKRRDMIKHETNAQKQKRLEREKKQAIADKQHKREQRQMVKQEKMEQKRLSRQQKMATKQQRREEKNRHKEQNRGFGGWLAAVISLGVVVLAFATVITVGAFNYTDLQSGLVGGYQSAYYELVGLVDNLDSNLNKARVTNNSSMQQKLLTDILVQSELAESVLEKFPIDSQSTVNLTSFINKTSDTAKSLLNKLANDESLTEADENTIEYIYSTNNKIKNALHEMVSTASAKEIKEWMKNSNGVMNDMFSNLENNTIETPKTIFDGPFAEQLEDVNAKGLKNLQEVSFTQAKEKCLEYFNGYNITETNYQGEVNGKSIVSYAFNLKDNNGREYYAQISKLGAKLVMFDMYEDCTDKNFDRETCVNIAKDYLQNIGINDMKEVWINESGSTATINFAYEQDGVVVYSDLIKVKVCETKGKVVGIEAISYWLNHGERDLASPSITQSEIKDKISSKIDVKSIRLSMIPTQNAEKLAYEVVGSYNGQEYYIYLDATNGRELEVFTLVNSKQGDLLM